MEGLESGGVWEGCRVDWGVGCESGGGSGDGDVDVWSVWSSGFVRDVSFAEPVEGVFALGTVLSVSLRDELGGGMYIFFLLAFVLSLISCLS